MRFKKSLYAQPIHQKKQPVSQLCTDFIMGAAFVRKVCVHKVCVYNGFMRKGVHSGFSFLELLLVLTLLSALVAVAVPAFSTLLQNPTEQEIKRLISVFQLLRNQAVLKGEAYRLVVDKAKATYWIEYAHHNKKGEKEYRPVAIKGMLGVHRFASDVRISKVYIFGEQVRDAPGYVYVNRFGLTEPWQMELKSGEEAYTVFNVGWRTTLDFYKGPLDENP